MVLEKLGIFIPIETITNMIELVDSNFDGVLQESEFC